MVVMAVQRHFGLGEAGAGLGEARGRHVDPADLAYARDKRRLGWSWQAIGQQLRVNAQDLRSQCEAITITRVNAPAAKGVPGPPTWWRALVAIEAGAARPAEIAAAIDIDTPQADSVVRTLKRSGLLAGVANVGGWTIPEAGREALARGRAGERIRSRPSRQTQPAGAGPIRAGSRHEQGLAAIRAGASDRHALAEVLGISPDNAGVVRQQLCRKGLVAVGGWSLTDKGVEAAKALAEADRG